MTGVSIGADWIAEAASSLVESLKSRGVPTERLSSFVTVDRLADFYGRGKKTVREALRARYSGQMDKLQKNLAFRLPSTYFLRRELGIYEGNLEEAVKRWPKVAFSKFDLTRNRRIPTQIGDIEAMLLGVFYADGNLTVDKDEEDRKRVTLSGTTEDFVFYRKWVVPALKQVFNMK